jgi:hypothetical protein
LNKRGSNKNILRHSSNKNKNVSGTTKTSFVNENKNVFAVNKKHLKNKSENVNHKWPMLEGNANIKNNKM